MTALTSSSLTLTTLSIFFDCSRRHAILTRTGEGVFTVECVGRNSIEAAGRELETGQRADVRAGQTIKIGIFELTITN